jgi:peptidoglycan/xylan/chitin deacetylase (PgdA/CDA1 family)
MAEHVSRHGSARGRIVLASALIVLPLPAAMSCGRVIKLEQAAEQESIELEVVLPAGAVCATGEGDPGAWADAVAQEPEPSCTQVPSSKAWPLWTNATPPGICYELHKRCSGLPDHVAYLTFDDGPADWTPAILETLSEHDVPATFFVNARGDSGESRLERSFRNESGELVKYRELLERIVAQGHTLGNHTRDHENLGKLSAEDVLFQLEQNERLINIALVRAGAQPHPLTLVRPPFGSPWTSQPQLTAPEQPMPREVVGLAVMRFGYNVLWNVDSTDSREWSPGEASTLEQLRKSGDTGDNEAYRAKVERIRDVVLNDQLVLDGVGIIVLLHDTHNTTRDALADIIKGLRARGYRFDALEGQVSAQFGRPSLELTPGPAMGLTSVRCAEAEHARSCERFAESDEAVCGRLWLAFEQLGGEPVVGRPIAAAERDGLVSQQFERGRIELHPEWPAPCAVVFVPNS